MANAVILQTFEWEMGAEGNFYKNLARMAPSLARRGFDAVWLPPASKATTVNDVGYGIYDLYDLGEFDQKGQVRTKYGTKDELLDAIKALQEQGIKVYMDVVLNHKAGADYIETFRAQPVQVDNRNQAAGEERDIDGWTGFNFPGRQDKYSDFHWNFNHFTGVDFDQKTGEKGIFRILGDNKNWAEGVSHEYGNFDYLMFADIDHRHPDVQKDLYHWADWLVDQTSCDGFRFDALKHIDSDFVKDYTQYLTDKYGDKLYLFGEFWSPGLDKMAGFLDATAFNLDLFDVDLHFRFYQAGMDPNFDLRQVFDQSLVQSFPMNAVTFVDNHDTQPGQSLESFVDRSFKERAYALILLRKDGYPCVFAGDYFGIHGGPAPQEGMADELERLLELRANYAYGEERDFFVDPHFIAWARLGDEEFPSLLATVISTAGDGAVEVDFGPDHAGKIFRDYTGHREEIITLDENGKASFPVSGQSLSCWVSPDARDGETLDKDYDQFLENLGRPKLEI
jgi:alpha-amylase